MSTSVTTGSKWIATAVISSVIRNVFNANFTFPLTHATSLRSEKFTIFAVDQSGGGKLNFSLLDHRQDSSKYNEILHTSPTCDLLTC